MFRSAESLRSVFSFARVFACAFAVLVLAATARESRAQYADPNAWVTDGTVAAMTSDGSTLYVGGRFEHVGTSLGACAMLDSATGTPYAAWPHVNAPVYAIASDGAGGWYVGGEFTLVNGVARAHAVHVRADGTLDAWAPDPDGAVNALLVRGGLVYMGGAFANAGGEPRAHLAAVDAATGVLAAWNPGANGVVYAMAPTSGAIVAGGAFTSAGGQARSFLAAFDPASGAATSWDPGADNVVVALAATNATVYVGGFFATLGGELRFGAGAVDATSGDATAWDPQPDNDVTAIAVSGPTVYLGGTFTWLGASPRAHVGAVDATSGVATAWNPGADGAVDAFAIAPGAVYAGGVFGTIGGLARSRIAALDPASGAALAWNPLAHGVAGTSVLAIGVTNGRVLAGGLGFLGDAIARANLAALDASTGLVTSWNPGVGGAAPSVSALAMWGSRVLVGGAFTTAGGAARTNLAAIDAASGVASSWNPGANGSVFALATGNGVVYAGGVFSRVGTRVRNFLGAIDSVTGVATSWDPEPNAAVHALAMLGGTLYAGGEFTIVGYLARSAAAAFVPPSATASAWNPNVGGTSPVVYALTPASIYGVTLGGEFATVGGEEHANLADVNLTDGAAWFGAQVDGTVRALSTNVFQHVGGEFANGGYPTLGFPLPIAHATEFFAMSGVLTSWDPVVNDDVLALAEAGTSSWLGGRFTSAGRLARHGLACIRVADASAPVVHVDAPDAGGTFATGDAVTIFWSAADDVGVQSADVYLSRTGAGGPWELLAAGVPTSGGTGGWTWTVSGAASADARIRVVARDWQGNTGEDVCDVSFALAGGGAGVVPGPIARVSLDAPSPNPCRGPASIGFALPSAQHVRLSVVDVQGREVAVLLDETLVAGQFTAPLPTGRLRAGLYFVRLRTPEQIEALPPTRLGTSRAVTRVAWPGVELVRRLIVLH